VNSLFVALKKTIPAVLLLGSLSIATTPVAQAQITINLVVNESTEVATATIFGSADLSNASSFAVSNSGSVPRMRPTQGDMMVGDLGYPGLLLRLWTLTKPLDSFGLVYTDVTPGMVEGPLQGITSSALFLDTSYVSGTALTESSMTIVGTLESLSLVEGTFTAMWGNETAAETLTLNVSSVSAVPEPSSFAALMGLAVLGLTTVGRRRRG
jgi:hypothetical protein